jgi:hypothetical protein
MLKFKFTLYANRENAQQYLEAVRLAIGSNWLIPHVISVVNVEENLDMAREQGVESVPALVIESETGKHVVSAPHITADFLRPLVKPAA